MERQSSLVRGAVFIRGIKARSHSPWIVRSRAPNVMFLLDVGTYKPDTMGHSQERNSALKKCHFPPRGQVVKKGGGLWSNHFHQSMVSNTQYWKACLFSPLSDQWRQFPEDGHPRRWDIEHYAGLIIGGEPGSEDFPSCMIQ